MLVTYGAGGRGGGYRGLGYYRGPRRGRGGRGGANGRTKDPCSVYVSFVNPIEAVSATELLQTARANQATLKFGRHCYLTFGTETEAADMLIKAGEKEFGGEKAYVDHAYKSQNARKEGSRSQCSVTNQEDEGAIGGEGGEDGEGGGGGGWSEGARDGEMY